MKKLKYNFMMATAAFLFIALGQQLFHLQNPQLAPSINIEKYFILWIILFLFSYSKSKIIRFLSLGFILFFSFFQWTHLSYYGTRGFPHEIWLLFSEFGEVTGTIKEELHHVLLPGLLTLPALAILYYLNKRWHEKLAKLPLVSFLFVFYFLYNPTRTFVTGNTWGRQPSVEEFDGVSAYLSLSYFLGRILPGKLSNERGGKKLLISKTKGDAKDVNFVVILGESLTPNHMSLYGYERETTPYLKSLKHDPNFFYTRALSSGVSSDVAVAFFFNNAFGLSGVPYIYSSENCLFNLARQQGFKTKFYSTQSLQQLRYINASICPKYIDEMKSLEDIDPAIEDSNAADDLFLVKELKEMDLGNKKNQFVVLHMRGNHAPFNLRYPAEFGKFVARDAATTERVGHYDNGVAYFDHFMQELLAQVKTYDTPTIVVYVSDHGEGLGEEGVWGHGSLNEVSATTPYLIYKHNLPELKIEAPKLPTHLNVSLFISKLLGFNFNYHPGEQFKSYEILGNDLDGFAGRMMIEIEDGKVVKKAVVD